MNAGAWLTFSLFSLGPSGVDTQVAGIPTQSYHESQLLFLAQLSLVSAQVAQSCSLEAMTVVLDGGSGPWV